MKKIMTKLAAAAAAVMTAATMFAATPAIPANAAGYGDITLNEIDTYQIGYDLPVTVFNDSGKYVSNIYIAPSVDTIWGADLLGDKVMFNGDVVDTTFDVHGNHTTYDVHVIFFDGSDILLTNVDLSDAPIDGIILEVESNWAYFIY